MKVTEKHIEDALTAWVTNNKGICLKGATNFDTGYPDRIIYMPGASAHVEVKGTSTRYHLNDKQKLWAGRVLMSKQPYYILESMAGLEHIKKDIYVSPAKFAVNTYHINGLQLVLHLNETTGTLELLSYKTVAPVRIFNALYNVDESHDKVIYRVFKKLEEMYPNTNYEDI